METAPLADDPLLRWRSEFPGLEDCVYMISHSLGCLPIRAAEHLEEFLANPPKGDEAERWVRHASSTLERLRSPDGSDPEHASGYES